MARNIPVLFATAALLYLAAGCGTPSRLDLCNAACDADKRCGSLTDAQAANCRTNCENQKGTLSDKDALDDKNCKNAGDYRKKTLECINMDCNKITSCLATVDATCVAK